MTDLVLINVLIHELQEKDKHTAEIISSVRAFRVELHFPLLKKVMSEAGNEENI